MVLSIEFPTNVERVITWILQLVTLCLSSPLISATQSTTIDYSPITDHQLNQQLNHLLNHH